MSPLRSVRGSAPSLGSTCEGPLRRVRRRDLCEGRRPLDVPLPGGRSAWPGDRRPGLATPGRSCGAGVLTRALTHGRLPVEVTTDRAPVYPRVIEEFVPAARHVLEQYANNPVEADHCRLKARRRPMRGLK